MKIIAPTNFSDASRNAVKYALDWCKDLGIGAQVQLLNTYLVPAAAPDQLIRINDELRTTSRKNLESERERIEKTMPRNGIRFELVSHMGTLKNVIDHLTKKEKVGFLVVGDEEDLESLLKNAHCPVLIVPSGSAYARIQNVARLRERGMNGSDPVPAWRGKFAPSAALHEVSVLGDSLGAKLMNDFVASKKIDFVIWAENSAPSTAALRDAVRGVCVPSHIPCLLLNEPDEKTSASMR